MEQLDPSPIHVCLVVVFANYIHIIFYICSKVKMDTVIEVWKEDEQNELSRVTAAGMKAILASPWYLGYSLYGSDWHRHYNQEPLNFNGLLLFSERCITLRA